MNNHFAQLLVLLALITVPTYCYTLKKYEILDLESTNEAGFAEEAAYWEAQNNLTTKLYTTCGNTLLLGGIGVLDNFASLQRTYDNLPAHQGIMGEIIFWFIDDWHEQDSLYISVLSNQTQHYFNRILELEYSSSWPSSVCGNPDAKDLIEIKYYFLFSHTGKSLTLQFINQLADLQDRIYFGIRDIKILFIPTTPAYGISCGDSSFFGPSYRCDCTTAQYRFYSTSYYSFCTSCDPTCTHCIGPGPTSCLVCPSNRYYDGTSCQSCHPNCATCTGPNENDCVNCTSGNYLYKNGTCLPGCNPPFSKIARNNVSYCDFPCNTSSFLYPNGSCLQSCSLPYKERFAGDTKFCEVGCNSNNYIYPNGSCLSFCNPPMKISSQDVFLFCLSPCDVNEFYYLNEMKCHSNCSSPSISRKEEFYSTCEPRFVNAIIEPNTLVEVNSPNIVGRVILLASLSFEGHSWGILIAALARMFQNIRYIEISYETSSELVIETLNSSALHLNFAPQIPVKTKMSIPYHTTPYLFHIYGTHSSFLVNFWQAFLSIMTLIFVLILLKISEYILTRHNKVSCAGSFVKSFRVLIQNALIIMLYGNYGDAILFSVIEFKSRNFDSTLGILGFILSLIFLFIIFLSIILHCWLLMKRQKLIDFLDRTDSDKDVQAFSIHYVGFKVLFHDFVYKSQYFLFVFLLRDILANMAVSVADEFAFYQTSILTILSIAIVIYLVTSWPFNNLLDNFQQLFCEVLLLLTNLASLTIAVMDETENHEEGMRGYLGKGIAIMNRIFNTSVYAMFGLKVLLILYNIYKSRQQKKEGRLKKLSIRLARTTSDVINESSIGKLKNPDQESFNQTDKRIFNFEVSIENTNGKDSLKQGVKKSKKPERKIEKLKKFQPKLDKKQTNNSKRIRVHTGKLAKGERGELYEENRLQTKPPEFVFDISTGPNQPKKNKSYIESEPSQAYFITDEGVKRNVFEVDLFCKEKEAITSSAKKGILDSSSNFNVRGRLLFKSNNK